jgi:hypothetical protein
MTTKKFIASFTICLSFLLYPQGARTESAENFKKEQEIVRLQMIQLSRELGVTCTECHAAKNWKDSSKANFKIAQDHMKTVEVIRASGFNGKKYPEASCFMCHQGRLKFASKMQHPEGSINNPDSKTEQ